MDATQMQQLDARTAQILKLVALEARAVDFGNSSDWRALLREARAWDPARVVNIDWAVAQLCRATRREEVLAASTIEDTE